MYEARREGWTKTLHHIILWHVGGIAVLMVCFGIVSMLIQLKAVGSFSVLLLISYVIKMMMYKRIQLCISAVLLFLSVICWFFSYTEYRNYGYIEHLHQYISHAVMAVFWGIVLLAILTGNGWLRI